MKATEVVGSRKARDDEVHALMCRLWPDDEERLQAAVRLADRFLASLRACVEATTTQVVSSDVVHAKTEQKKQDKVVVEGGVKEYSDGELTELASDDNSSGDEEVNEEAEEETRGKKRRRHNNDERGGSTKVATGARHPFKRDKCYSKVDDFDLETATKVELKVLHDSMNKSHNHTQLLHQSLEEGREYSLGLRALPRRKDKDRKSHPATVARIKKRLWEDLGHFPQLACCVVGLFRFSHQDSTKLVRQAIDADPKEKAFWSRPLTPAQLSLLGKKPTTQ
ncbi:uncharacterized protein ACA1_126970 [Acanthamoeba castellanii str. Neff]|uniref:Uncharacterized protein n=1 Tax=Acanthamoeba castellanii (strain ATCC 30010 / Neff) TaxID=1257118 RepID=L8GGD5_ACACF|nr:uncharacterized protein ACA1_126970 [Acanthamoeba castellanii str. Neff]ELR11256.1 hypothetical protein ACA1_126970 [Acanthamoeba castellanii str. Neff]